MALRNWITACTGHTSEEGMEGICARLLDALQVEENEGDTQAHRQSEAWKDLTLSTTHEREPKIPREISIPLGNTGGLSTTPGMGEDFEYESLLGLQILDDVETGPPRDAPEANADCSWTYSTASTHGKELVDFLKFDERSSYASFDRSKPPLAPPNPLRLQLHRSHKAASSSSGTATATTISSSSRTNDTKDSQVKFKTRQSEYGTMSSCK
jgi:hypothetical protein